jgi:hypothetical protein
VLLIVGVAYEQRHFFLRGDGSGHECKKQTCGDKNLAEHPKHHLHYLQFSKPKAPSRRYGFEPAPASL